MSDDDDEYPNHRKVEWLVHLPRSDFSQSALYEIGAFITVFLIRNHASEFLGKAGQATGIEVGKAAPTDADSQPEDCVDDDVVTAGVSLRAELTTADFIIRRIMAGQSGHQFEDLVAHLLECMGYNARVTPKSGDGGVDVIAHMDALGFQPPIVKVQCKRTTGQTGAPEANQLLGTLGEGEYGLLINLGSYSQR
ncbi:restriction endonuclease [Maricaulis sp.]|uniref:restriction endonuclease n=1 Tax=Maricaulis sp. TaxID=1486257 RepID=UPI002627C43E|nr:restriction endonuclease [Maricaulis sp.]MDF1769451.1 restriction endonuclease [Maricaulis sp.]